MWLSSVVVEVCPFLLHIEHFLYVFRPSALSRLVRCIIIVWKHYYSVLILNNNLSSSFGNTRTFWKQIGGKLEAKLLFSRILLKVPFFLERICVVYIFGKAETTNERTRECSSNSKCRRFH